jgi:hypothetical protein
MNREVRSPLRTPHLPAGVLTDHELLLGGIVEGKPVLHALLLPREAGELDGLLAYLWEQEVTTVWVLPIARLSREMTTERLEQENQRWTSLVHSASTTPTRPSCALFFPREARSTAGRRLTLAFPAHAGWEWKLPDALTLLATVIYLEQLLARPVVDIPELCSAQLLSDLTLKEPVSELRASPVDLWSLSSQQGRPLPFLQGGRELSWKRPLTLAEERQRYLHKYTYFSRNLRACQGVSLGIGTVQSSPTGRACDGARPGIWRVKLNRAGSLFDGKALPGCLEQEWMSTPQLTSCRAIGYEVQVQEGIFWQQSHHLLDSWASFLWEASERLHTQPQRYRHPQACANASITIQQLVEGAVTSFALREEEGGWSRPDWQAQILGRARALLFTDLTRFVKRGTMPVLLHGDAFWTASADPNPLTAVPGLLPKRRWNGYRVGYAVPLFLSREVRDLFRGEKAIDEVVNVLDTLAEEVFPL